jgi:hypothetical protein
MSVYAKAGSVNWMALYIVATAPPYVYFDLANGVLGGVQNNVIDASMQDMGGGWYRCTIAFDKTATEARIFTATANGTLTTTSGDSIYIQDAQLNQGLIAQEVITTTTSAVYGGITDNVPRLDYTDSSCPALLLEPQRTNSFPHSEYLGQWSANRLDRTANNIDSPEGVQNAYKMIQQSGFTTASNINYAGITAGTKTLSIFAKAGTFDHIALSYNGVTYFNLTNGTIGTTASGHTAVMTDMGDGWYRCAITKTTTATYTAAYYFAQNNGTLTTTDTQGYMYAYGAQIEAGSYATSYIPTYGSSVTRVADTGIINSATDLIGQTEGTLFVEVDLTKVPFENRRFFAIGDGTASNRIGIGQQSGKSLEAFVVNNGILQTIFSQSGTSEQVYKIAIAYKVNDFALYINGSKVGTDTSGSVPSVGNVYLGVSEILPTTTQISDGIKQALLFKTRLTNAELQDLTTL